MSALVTLKPHAELATRVALVHPGMQYAAQVARQLQRHGLLSEFWTGLAVSDRGMLGPWLRDGASNPVAKIWSRRLVRKVPSRQIRLQPLPELLAAARLRRGVDPQEVFHERNAAFQQALPSRVFRENRVVVGFDTSSWLLADRCAAEGTALVLDQSIAHPLAKRDIYARIRREFPAWAEDLETRRPEVLAAEETEHRAAALIMAASSFTRRTLMAHGVEADRITVNPYGVDLAAFTPQPEIRPRRPVRFAFIGGVSARKGIPLLLDVWGRMDTTGAELWLLGHVAPRFAPLVQGRSRVVARGGVSHLELNGLLHECDVLVFPSYFEGFGLVLLEAMACGLPVIATDATAAPDIITDGEEGFVLPAGDGAMLRERMERFIRDPALAGRMGRAARRTAEQFTWDAFGDRWAEALRRLVSRPT